MADYKAGQAYLAIVPSLDGFGDAVRRQLREELGDQVKLPVKPDLDPGQGEKDGDEYGGAFGRVAKAKIESALKDLPNPTIDADSTPAERKIAELRARLEELRDKRIGVDLSGEEALAKAKEIAAELDELARKHPDVQVRADTAAARADLLSLEAEVDKLDNRRASIFVSDNGSANESKSNINALMAAGISLGPAIIPVAAAVAAALGGIGIGAIAGIGALGTIKLAFSGISDGVKALQDAQTKQGQNAAQQAAQQISSANSIANAQDGLKAAVQGVADAQHNAAIANEHAVEQVSNAERSLQDTYRSTALTIQNAVQNEAAAEQQLTTAVQNDKLAQDALTLSRQQAERQIRSLTLAVEDGALAERQAQLNIEQAKQQLDQTLANPTATQLQRQQAQLSYDQAVQQLKDVQNQNQNLRQDQAAAAKAGVEGSQQVQAAQRGAQQATQGVADAQRNLTNAQAAVVEARRSGDEQIAKAEQSLADAQKSQAETARQGLESVAKAQQSVVQAQRSLQDALASQAAQQASAANSANALAQAMGKLTPEGQEFAKFIVSLKPQLTSLQEAAQRGLLPGVEDGIKAMLPLMPLLTGLIGSISDALGNMARNVGTALASPYWVNFINFIKGEAGPSITTLGDIMGNIAHGLAGILEALKPIWDQMGQGLENITARFAHFGETAGQNKGFQDFIQYVKEEGPKVVQTLGDLVAMFTNIGRAMGPLGGIVLGVVDSIAKFVNGMDPQDLKFFVDTLFLGYEAWKAWQIISIISGFLKEYNIIAIATKLVTGDWTVAQELLNAVLLANPIGIVIAVIAALVVGVIYCYTHFQTFRDIVNDVWNVIKTVISTVWNFTIKVIFDAIVSGLRLMGDGFNIFLNLVQLVWNGIKIVFDALTGNWSGVQNAFSAGMDNLQNIWNRLIDIAKVPVNFVINTVYNSGIVPLWNGIAGLFGLGKLNPAAPLAEGGVLPGYSPGIDSVPAVLSPGEGVLVPEAVRGLGPDFVYAANAHFSGGRSTGGVGQTGAVRRFAAGGVVGSIIGGISDFISDPLGAVKKAFNTVVTMVIPGTGGLHDALAAIPGKVVDGAVNLVKSAVAKIGSFFSAAFTGSPDLMGWIMSAIQLTGVPASWAGPLSVLIGRESGGNPNAINLWDSNAAAGHPSQGLMQTIPSTFQAYHQAGTSFNILDPIANIAAGINYIRARYGDISNVQQANPNLPPRGYDSGGWLPPGMTLAYNGTGQPERVLTNAQWSALASGARGGDMSGRPISVNVYPRAEHSEIEIAQQVSRQLSLAMRTNT